MKNDASKEELNQIKDGLTIPRFDFPYPVRECPFCEHPLFIVRALHLTNIEHYKCIMVCLNKQCKAKTFGRAARIIGFDHQIQWAYVRVYYSSELAQNTLDSALISVSLVEGVKYEF